MKIAILGGGVAGLTCGIALQQKGFDVEIYERGQRATTIGAGVILWPNATLILDRLGLLDRLSGRAGTPTMMQRISSSNIALGCLDITLINEKIGYPSLSILRRDLMEVLLNAFLEAKGALHFDHQVISISPVADQQVAKIEFLTGLTLTPDIIIGAEGRMSSPSREFVLGDNAPIYQNFINWVGVFEGEKPIFDAKSILDFWGVGARFGIVPISRRKAYWAAGVTSRAVGTNQPDRYKQEMMNRFHDWPQPIPQLIQSTPLNRISKIYVHDHDPIQVWHRDNLILVGDAAHAPLPTSGQGACQAIEDAWHLANALSQGGANIQNAFKKFAGTRVEKTTAITSGARQFAQSVFNDDPSYCRKRDEASKSIDYPALAKVMADGWDRNLPDIS